MIVSTRFLKQVQKYLDEEDLEGLLIFLDMEKAFDRVSWKYMKEALKALGHTAPYMSWIEALYDEKRPPKRKIYANGDFSRAYNIYLGTAQGCPLSPLLFLVVMEALTRLLKTDKKLKGIQIDGREHRVNHFADDSIAALAGVRQLPRFNSRMKIFCDATNMLENMSKRDILGLGNLGNEDPTMVNDVESWVYDETKKDWTVDRWKGPGEWVISLGAAIGNNCGNFGPFWGGKYTEGKAALSKVKHAEGRGFSGKHQLLNGKYYGKMRYWLWSDLLPKELEKAMVSDANNFLWLRSHTLVPGEIGTKGATGKWIARNAEYGALKKGGLGALHWPCHILAFRANWVVRLFHPREGLWKGTVDYWLGEVGRKALVLNLSKPTRKEILKKIPDAYLRSCVETFWELNVVPHPDHEPESWEEVATIPLLQNGHFQFRVRGLYREIWSHPALDTIGACHDPTQLAFYPRTRIMQEVKNVFPHLTRGQYTTAAAAHVRMQRSLRTQAPNIWRALQKAAVQPVCSERRVRVLPCGGGIKVRPPRGTRHQDTHSQAGHLWQCSGDRALPAKNRRQRRRDPQGLALEGCNVGYNTTRVGRGGRSLRLGKNYEESPQKTMHRGPAPRNLPPRLGMESRRKR